MFIFCPSINDDVYVLKLFSSNRKLEKMHHYHTLKTDLPQSHGELASEDFGIFKIRTFVGHSLQ